MNFPTPKLFCSRCLGFEACRYNSQIIPNNFVEKLKTYVDFINTCPEVEIGLGVPRDPIRIIRKNGEDRLIQPSTENNYTEDMKSFSQNYLKKLEDVDGFILKAGSPSCGPKNVKIYPKKENAAPIAKENGFFARQVKDRYSHLAVEDEKRLNNAAIRHHFLIKIFTFASFRDVKKSRKMKKLIDFHSNNKFLLKAYNQKEMRVMGKIVANMDDKTLKDILENYEKHLWNALDKGPNYKSIINVLENSLGYFSDELNSQEKRLFLNTVEMYREGRSSFKECLTILQSWIARFDQEYLKKQTFFNPYPEELTELIECADRRDYWD
ncbi:MAG: YbgA family protein [Thermoplasmatota archaeon]